jgi:hypothetical protein
MNTYLNAFTSGLTSGLDKHAGMFDGAKRWLAGKNTAPLDIGSTGKGMYPNVGNRANYAGSKTHGGMMPSSAHQAAINARRAPVAWQATSSGPTKGGAANPGLAGPKQSANRTAYVMGGERRAKMRDWAKESRQGRAWGRQAAVGAGVVGGAYLLHRMTRSQDDD